MALGGEGMGAAAAVQDLLANPIQTPVPVPVSVSFCQWDWVSLSGMSLGQEVALCEECWIGSWKCRLRRPSSTLFC